MAEYDRLETLIQREEHVAELEARAAEREEGERSRQRPNGGDRQAPAGGGGEQRTYDQAFDESLRRCHTAVDAADRALFRDHRAQITHDSPGGYTLPPIFVTGMIKYIHAWWPMLDPGITHQLEQAN